ncbi:MAG: NIPSNAP family containing protein [Bacteroidetes bacterium]|nr:MAG: NIPSNAP family containing protein [Bacteroidota bacterium]
MAKIFSLTAKMILILIALFLQGSAGFSTPPPSRTIIQIRIYQLKSKEQEERVDKFLQSAFIPVLHRMGINQVGVFKPIGNDTAATRRIYVLIPFQSLDQWLHLPETLSKDASFNNDGKEYLESPHNDPPFSRQESIILRAFPDMPNVQKPTLSGPWQDRIYELRSYESATERKLESKVRMFNEGDEISIFKRLNFNAVFYGEVMSGSRMPNLMYMTSFDNMAAHDQHWKSFGDDPTWKKLLSMPEYQNNVSHADIWLLHPTSYSDL